MGKRGPPKKPVKLKALQGTTRRDRDGVPPAGRAPATAASPGDVPPWGPHFPALPEGAPPCPEDLSVEARKVWHEVVPELLRIGTLAPTDLGTLRGYCAGLARVEALEKIAEATPLVDGKDGQPRANPAGVEARKLRPVVDKLATNLGLHYAARSRNGAPVGPVDAERQRRINDAEQFLFGKLRAIPGGKAG